MKGRKRRRRKKRVVASLTQTFPRRMFNLKGKKCVDIGFTAAGEKAGLDPRASLEKDTCNVSTDANPRSGNELLKKLERRDLCV